MRPSYAGAHAAFLPSPPAARDDEERGALLRPPVDELGASDYDSDDSVASALLLGERVPRAPLEGLHSARMGAIGAAAAASGATSAAARAPVSGGGEGVWREVCPLLTNPVLLGWTLCSVALGFAAVCSPWLRATLQLAPLDVPVRLPHLWRASRQIPAAMLLLWPLAVFLIAELAKLAHSCLRHRATKDARDMPYARATA